jgi:hypothetical protein
MDLEFLRVTTWEIGLGLTYKFGSKISAKHLPENFAMQIFDAANLIQRRKKSRSKFLPEFGSHETPATTRELLSWLPCATKVKCEGIYN